MKLCKGCNTKKSIKEFYKNVSAKDKHSHECSSCTKKRVTLYKQSKKGMYDLKQLLFFSKRRSGTRGWNVARAKEVVHLYIEAKKHSIKFKEYLKQIGYKGSVGNCNVLIQELFEAGRQNMTIEQYFEAGRPFKAENKVIVEHNKK